MPTETSLDPHVEMDYMKKKEDEHLRLMRQVRIIQTDRSHAVEGVHPIFRRQDRLLRTLKKEYSNLKKDLRIATAGAHKKKDKRMKRDLKNSIFNLRYTEAKQEDDLTTIEQLDELLARNNNHMLSLRSLVAARYGAIEERRCQSEQRLVSTENKLETAMLRFNFVQHENMKIRLEIEHMLKDRALFNQSWNKMLSILKTGKKFLMDLFESSTLAYDQRDEWCGKLRSMQDKGMMDQMMQVQEMRSLQKAYDHDTKLYHFLLTKSMTRVNKQAEQRENEIKKKTEEQLKNELEYHDKILDDIQNYTNEMSFDKIKDKFRFVEQSNFSVYELMTAYIAENVALKKDLSIIRRNVEDRRDYNDQQEELRQQKLQMLRDQLSELSARNEVLRQKNNSKNRQMDRAMHQIEELFKMLGCSLEPYQNLLGDKQPSFRNQTLTLQLMTEKIKEYIEIVYYCERGPRSAQKSRGKSPDKSTDKSSRSRLKKYTIYPDVNMHSCSQLQIKTPSDPCPACFESWWTFKLMDTKEHVFDKEETLAALRSMKSDLTFDRSERIHPITDCKSPQSRIILAKRYKN